MTTQEAIDFTNQKIQNNANNIALYQADTEACMIMLGVLQKTLDTPSADLQVANDQIAVLEAQVDSLKPQDPIQENPAEPAIKL